MKQYDLVISLGFGCPTAGALKESKITEKSYPLDWSGCDGDASEQLLRKCNLIKNHFENAFNIEDFIEYSLNTDPDARCVKNVKTGLHYWHDFPWKKSVQDFFPEFVAKYQRRVKRLYDDVEAAKNILFVYQDDTGVLPIKAITESINILKNSFPQKNINMLVILSIATSEQTECAELNLNIDNVRVLTCQKTDPKTHTPAYRVYNVEKILKRVLCGEYYNFVHDKDIINIGLGVIESFGRWSNSQNTFFRLQTKSKQSNVSVCINVVPFVRAVCPTQKCKIICNGHEITEMVFDKPDRQPIKMIVPNDNDGNLDFVFEFDNPQSPQELGLSGDTRKLALGFIDAVISDE